MPKSRLGVKIIKKEFQVASRLFEEEISVPEPGELVDVILPNRRVLTGYTMQRIYGVEGFDLEGNLMKHAEDLLDNEIDRCISLGFNPQDYGLHNALYVQSSDNIYILDFELWGSID